MFVEGSKTKRLLSVSAVVGTVGQSGYSGNDGPANAAKIDEPAGIALDSKGNIYFADRNNHAIRKVTRSSGYITTVAGDGTSGHFGDDGPATAATFDNPSGVAIDTVGNIYISDTFNYVIRKVSIGTGIITRVAGMYSQDGYTGDGGPAKSAHLNNPEGVAVDILGQIYIADTYNHAIRIVSTTGIITTLAGNGTSGYCGDNGHAASAMLSYPFGVAVDLDGNIYIADSFNHIIRRVDTSTGIITTVAGTYGKRGGYSGDGLAATLALLNVPHDVAVDDAGNILIADNYNSAVRIITGSTGIITTLATDLTSFGVAIANVDQTWLIYAGDARRYVIQMITPSEPTYLPTTAPTYAPTSTPTTTPTSTPTCTPTSTPTCAPTYTPTYTPTSTPTNAPTYTPTSTPTNAPSYTPTSTPTTAPSCTPTSTPTSAATLATTSASAPTSCMTAPTPLPRKARKCAPASCVSRRKSPAQSKCKMSNK